MATSDPTTPRRAFIYGAVALGVFMFSISAILVRYASEAPSLAVATWRTLFAVAMLAPFALGRIGGEVQRFGRRDWAMTAGAGVLLGIHFTAWIESIYHTTIASATVLVSTSPLLLALFGWLLLRERVTLRVGGALALAFGGMLVLAWGDAHGASEASNALLGDSLAFAAAVLFTFYLLIGRVARRKASWLAYLFPLYVTTALTVLAITLVRGVPLLGYSPQVYLMCGAMALGPQIIGHGSFNFAVKYITPAVLGLVTLLEPIGAALLALFLFGEVPALTSILGMAIILGAVALAVAKPKPVAPS